MTTPLNQHIQRVVKEGDRGKEYALHFIPYGLQWKKRNGELERDVLFQMLTTAQDTFKGQMKPSNMSTEEVMSDMEFLYYQTYVNLCFNVPDLDGTPLEFEFSYDADDEPAGVAVTGIGMRRDTLAETTSKSRRNDPDFVFDGVDTVEHFAQFVKCLAEYHANP
jgi:hypothetical protein